jgi:hypothetical protein
MATFTWYFSGSAGPAWFDIDTDTVVFSGTGGITDPVTVGAWNDAVHIGDGDPGTDQCGVNHSNWVKYIDTDSFDNGSGSQVLNETNLTQTECVLRIFFNDASSVTTSNVRFYSYDGTTTTTEAPGIDCVAWESETTPATAWSVINDDTTSGALTVGSIGGDNAGERLTLSGQGPATQHTWYIAVSASPESVGAKADFDFGIALTYS